MADEYWVLKAQLAWQYTLEMFREKIQSGQGLKVESRRFRKFFQNEALPAVSNMIEYNRPRD